MQFTGHWIDSFWGIDPLTGIDKPGWDSFPISSVRRGTVFAWLDKLDEKKDRVVYSKGYLGRT